MTEREFTMTLANERHMITVEVDTESFFRANFTITTYIWTADGWEVNSVAKMNGQDLSHFIHKLVDLHNASNSTQNLKVVQE